MTEPPNTVNIVQPGAQTITFSLREGTWLMKISEKSGVEFNLEAFPEHTPDEYAKEVIHILESCFTIKFERRNKSLES